MSDSRREVTEDEVRKIAMEHIAKNPSNTFKFTLVNINNNPNRYPCWSVIFEMRTNSGDLVDGPLILGIDEYGDIIFVG